jgi:uncharacterized protein involved in exopolysaccharide biosynthesis
MDDDKTKDDPRESKVEGNVPRQYDEGVIDFGQYWAVLRPNLWKIALLSLAVGLLTLLVMFQLSNIYQTTAVITPAIDEKKPSPALGALASFGLDFGGGASKVEDLETLLRSNDLTVRVFRKYNLWPILLKDKYDPATGMIQGTWKDYLFDNVKGPKRPGDWDAIREAKERLKVSVNKKAGTASISFESPSAEGAATIVQGYIEEAKNRLQEEAFDRATKNKKFIEEQIGRTVDALTRDRLYSLLGQEIEREMMARNREQFGFRLIDSPRVPDRKSRPKRGLASLAATIITGFVFLSYFSIRSRRRN